MRFTGTFIIVVILFVIVLITSNIIAVKPIQLLTLPFEFLGSSSVVLPAAIIIFPISYIVGDVLTEVYGFQHRPGSNLAGLRGQSAGGSSPYGWLGLFQPPVSGKTRTPTTPFLGQVPWILLASFVAYLFGEFSNSTVLALLKYKMRGRLLFVRTIGSTIVGQGLDSFIFIYIAFGLGGDWSAAGLLSAALAQWIVKVLYETGATPFTYAVVGYMKRKEEMDVTDVPRSLNPVGIFA